MSHPQQFCKGNGKLPYTKKHKYPYTNNYIRSPLRKG